MLKFLIFLTLLACSSFFVTDVFSLEIELLKESDRLMDAEGWLKLGEQEQFQEQIQIIIDKVEQKNKINVMILSTDNEDIKLPVELESKIFDSKINSIVFTNQFNCAKASVDDACIIISVERDGDDLRTIKENAQKITDQILDEGFLSYFPEFHSVFVTSNVDHTSPDETESSKKGTAKVTYTIKKHSTFKLFNAFSPKLVNLDIINDGGFYNIAEELSKQHFTDFTLTYIPRDQDTLRILSISLFCSNESSDIETPYCLSQNIDEQISNGIINPLEFFQIENINRSNMFSKEFLPLNTVIQVIINSESNLQVESVNSHVIKKLDGIGDVQNDGWFFMSKSGKTIDGRYIFGQKSSVSKNDLVFSIKPYSGSDTEIKEVGEGGGCLIATAAFGSELAPQVQFLREIRDNTVLQTESGTSFMTSFNQFYYSFSPVIADYERENSAFKEAVKLTLTPLLTSLTLLQYVDIGSESEMLGYGIGIILLNIGMYFVAPVILIMIVKKRIY